MREMKKHNRYTILKIKNPTECNVVSLNKKYKKIRKKEVIIDIINGGKINEKRLNLTNLNASIKL